MNSTACPWTLSCPSALPAALPLTLGEPMPELAGALPILGEGVRLIPYALWDNRDPGAMAVWLRETHQP